VRVKRNSDVSNLGVRGKRDGDADGGDKERRAAGWAASKVSVDGRARGPIACGWEPAAVVYLFLLISGWVHLWDLGVGVNYGVD
jgi:hypothetical protein